MFNKKVFAKNVIFKAGYRSSSHSRFRMKNALTVRELPDLNSHWWLMKDEELKVESYKEKPVPDAITGLVTCQW